jgi:O-antigen ligase
MIEAILYAIPFTNILFAPFLFFPFITLKALSLRALIAILFLKVKYVEFDFKEKIFLFVSLFILSSLLSTIFSLDPYRSFWGNAERMEGFFSLFIYFLLFLSLRVIFKDDDKKIYNIVVSLIIFGIYACLGVLPIFLKDPKIRPDGIMGNAAYMGIVGMLTFFLSIFLLEFLKIYNKKSNFAKILSILGLIFGFILIIISQTRSAFLGFLGGILIYGFLKFPKKLKILLLALVLIFILILATISPEKINLPILSRISELLHGKIVGSSLTRLIVWKMFLNAFLQKPIFGWGLEMSPFLFGKFINPDLFKVEQAIFDRAHNKYVELLATQGIFGFLTYILILIFLIYFSIKNKIPSLTALFVSFSINNFFIFDIQYTWIVFFTFCAWASSKSNEGNKIIFEFKFLKPAIFAFVIIISIVQFLQIRLVLENLKKVDINFFFDSIPKAGPYKTELVVHVGSRFLNNINKYESSDIIKFYVALKDQYLKEKTDLRLSSMFANFATSFYKYLQGEKLEEEREFIRKNLLEFFEKFPYYPPAVLYRILYFIEIEQNPQKAKEYFLSISSTSSIYMSYGVLLSQNLWQKGFYKEAYEILQILKEKNYKFNDKEKEFLNSIEELLKEENKK